MNTNNITGQSPLIARMDQILAGGRIVHAYLFEGPAGAGKKTMSGLFAQALLCEKSEDKPCNKCIPCKQYESGNHLDVLWVRRLEDKTSISVDQIRELQSKIKVKPFQDGKRICFIDEAHLMNHQAQNALLKTLEEPPSHTIFFLLADNTSSLLPTIISRCQLFRVDSLSREDIALILNNRLSIGFEEATTYASLSQGNPGQALALAGDEEFRALRERLINGMNDAGTPKIMDLIGPFTEYKERVDDLFTILQLWIRDIIILKETSDLNLIINRDQSSLLRKQASYFTNEALKAMIGSIEKSRKRLKSNTNYQLTIEAMLSHFQGGAHNASRSRYSV
ncbi:MAG: DNA polymerase III subunit delta' [Clostridiales bacterium]|nr:DNA polymerase III subunit delta' [Clostridiales bacterium]